MQKINNKKNPKHSVDRDEINELIKYIDIFDKLDDLEKENVFEEVRKYLSMILNLFMDVEHSKISIAKLQKLFGFLSHRSNSKEALGIQNLVKMK